jgi:hypothetical protein
MNILRNVLDILDEIWYWLWNENGMVMLCFTVCIILAIISLFK